MTSLIQTYVDNLPGISFSTLSVLFGLSLDLFNNSQKVSLRVVNWSLVIFRFSFLIFSEWSHIRSQNGFVLMFCLLYVSQQALTATILLYFSRARKHVHAELLEFDQKLEELTVKSLRAKRQTPWLAIYLLASVIYSIFYFIGTSVTTDRLEELVIGLVIRLYSVQNDFISFIITSAEISALCSRFQLLQHIFRVSENPKAMESLKFYKTLHKISFYAIKPFSYFCLNLLVYVTMDVLAKIGLVMEVYSHTGAVSQEESLIPQLVYNTINILLITYIGEKVGRMEQGMIFSVREKPLIGLTAYDGEEILKFLKEVHIESIVLTAGDFFSVDAGTLPSMATFIAVNTIVIIQMQTD